MARLSNTKIDKLGERLKSGTHSDADINLLDEYRRSFHDSYSEVLDTIQKHLVWSPSGRAAKTVPSIVDKLRRESIRLSQIQDIAGCRIVVPDTAEQNRSIAVLQSHFPEASVIDRRTTPSHGYRAVHLIVRAQERWVEIQVRTELQHLWARVSEALADTFESSIKYGGGSAAIQEYLSKWSATVSRIETQETSLARLPEENENTPKYIALLNRIKDELREKLTVEFEELKKLIGN